MARIFVAFRTDGPEEPQRIADGSLTRLKKRMRPYLESEWTLATYTIKPNVPSLVQIIEDIAEVEADEAENLRVNSSGQVRKVD